MPKIGSSSVFRTVKLPRLGKETLVKALVQLGPLRKVDELFEGKPVTEKNTFIDEVLKELDISFQYYTNELKRIPEDGAVALVSNHPLAGLDALILIKMLRERRPDLKVFGSDLPHGLGPVAKYWEIQDDWGNGKLKESLAQGKAVVVFPSAGQKSSFSFSERRLRDGTWNLDKMGTLASAAVPVTPIYIRAHQTLIFHVLQNLSTRIPNLKLATDLPNIRSKAVQIRVGRTIYPKELALYAKPQDLATFIRRRVYFLSNALEDEPKFFNLNRPQKPKPIAPAISANEIQSEYEFLCKADRLLDEKRDYQVFCAQAAEIPFMLKQIGRLREITFRAVGEGTNLPLDLDQFDYHYHHLILWDRSEAEIVGAYRLGIGSEIYPELGHNGFYLSTLFKFRKRIRPMLGQSLEMGRAFIIKEHQQKPLPLFVLWNGIRKVMTQHPELHYIIGCASISNSFSKFSRNLMVGFLLKNYNDASLSDDIRPRKAYRLKLKGESREMILQSKPEDLVKFDRKIEEVEPGSLRFPPLIKKYLQQKAMMVCFNVDPLFNNSLDGFMYIHRDNLDL
jgi:putative hemolysin